jgi:hypothetical protein
MDESVLRARSSNQRSHRSPRHAVARALTHQASPASIRAKGFSPLTGSRPASRPGTLSENTQVVGWITSTRPNFGSEMGPPHQ